MKIITSLKKHTPIFLKKDVKLGMQDSYNRVRKKIELQKDTSF